jgi:predicted dehydrogenase
MAEKIKWGILATGDIAKKFATGLKVLPDAELFAIGSRTKDAAEKFGKQFGIPRCHGSYQALASDPEVDVVYIATPHSLHKENTLMCLKAGKAVLCEKPFAINAAEAEEMVDMARREKLFLMEAMWTRFIPAVRQAQVWIDEGAIGEVRMVEAGFGYRDQVGITYDPSLGGGSLLDVGVYPITIADIAFKGPPQKIAGYAAIAGGIDEQAAIIFSYQGGGLALLKSAVRTKTPGDALIMGTGGMIKIHEPFWRSKKLSLMVSGKDEETLDVPMLGNGYNYEAAEVMRCIRAGELESKVMPLSKTLEVMSILDAIRGQWGLKYPMES